MIHRKKEVSQMKHEKRKKTNQYGKTAKRLMNYVATTYKLQFIIVFFTIIVSSLANVAGPLFLRYLVDDFITPLLGQKSPDFTAMTYAVCLLAVCYYVGVICTYVYNRLMVNIGQGVQKRIRDELFEKMQKLPIGYFDSHTHGELMSLYTNDIDTLRQMISQSMPQAFSAFITVITIFITMLFLNIPLCVIAIIMVIIMILLTKILGGKSGEYFIAQQNNLGQVNGYIEEMMSGQKVIKVFCHEEKAKDEFDVLNDKLCVSATQANKYANFIMPVMGNLGNLQYVLTAVVGGILNIFGNGALTLGILASFLQLTRSFTMPFSQIAQQLNAIIMALAGAKRIFETMDQTPELDEGYVTLVNVTYDKKGQVIERKERTGMWAWKHPHQDGCVTYTKLEGNVRFTQMDFGYTEEKMVLHDLTLFAKPGQKLAFVGSTGAGKTTITNLINRFYDISDGKIHYDGININKIKKADLRRSLGMVLQDTHLFTGTIRDNIRYGKLDATDEEVYAAAKLANTDQFIKLLPKGYDTFLTGDGEQLSQGQRQLIAIARAAIANPPVLILDEATSSIDTRTEGLVQKGMDGLMKGRTVFVIAHRLSTIQNSDAIMVLENGRIIERGNHMELLEKKGTYCQLYTGALELS